MTDRDLYLCIRQALLMLLDGFERWMIARGYWQGPTTSECRKRQKGIDAGP